eukprot:TRINITY_DN17245_c0_g1_i4.p1 TRINITY_DN17245_c0_g1~~TRINITY_DN17245_c0_g1_i4.p1  ORF type:complete len:222 (-),score=61.15 TRINITY_DN17245_c0_g1_i4:443-1108(-)
MSNHVLYFLFFFLMIRRPPRSTLSSSSAASDVYKRQEEESSEVFEVERIIDKRIVKSKVEYLVSWRGYTAEHNSFEPKANLRDCRREIEKYEMAAAEAERKSALLPVALRAGPNDWLRVEEQWMRKFASSRENHVPYSVDYHHPRAPDPNGQRCCAAWNGLECDQVAASGRGYCAHHLALVKGRMVDVFSNTLSREEENQLMSEQDGRRMSAAAAESEVLA